jgi:hypothetical protein
MKRRIISLSGQDGRIAVADDGSVWFWDGTKWEPWQRPELPESEGVDFYHRPEVIAALASSEIPDVLMGSSNAMPLPPKRGPGRPRKNP